MNNNTINISIMFKLLLLLLVVVVATVTNNSGSSSTTRCCSLHLRKVYYGLLQQYLFSSKRIVGISKMSLLFTSLLSKVIVLAFVMLSGSTVAALGNRRILTSTRTYGLSGILSQTPPFQILKGRKKSCGISSRGKSSPLSFSSRAYIDLSLTTLTESRIPLYPGASSCLW